MSPKRRTRHSPSRRNARAHAQMERLLEAAGAVFLEHGYGMASIDMVAAAAHASKKTLYSYFPNKEELFQAALARLCERGLAPLRVLQVRLENNNGNDPAEVLARFGEALLELVMSPLVLSIHRAVLAEALRFPDVARLFYETGPGEVHRIVCAHFLEQRRAGHLRFDDVDEVVAQFIHSIIGEPQRRVLFGVEPALSPRKRRVWAEAAVRKLLRAIGGRVRRKRS